MRPVSVCATSASGPSTINLGLGFGVASASAAACCARPLPALAAAACSRPLHRHPSLTSGAPGTGLSGAASARQHHRLAVTLVASALKEPGAATGTDGGGMDGSSSGGGGGGGLVRSRSSRTTLTRSAPAADVAAAAALQVEPHGQPQRRLRRRTETQAVEPGAPADGPAATTTTATTTATHSTSSSTDYIAWKVSELQDALAARGLPRTGRKAELVERLAAAVASGAAAGAGSRSALASSAPAAAGPSVAAATAAAAEAAAPPPRQRSRLTVARSTATADVENGRGAAAAAPSGTAGRAGRAAAAATAANANTAIKQGSSDAESGAASGGFLDALFDTLTLDITVREQRPGRRPRPATTDGAAARSPSASRTGSTAADSPPAQSARAAAAAGRGTDSLGSVQLDLGGEGDDEPAAQPAAAAVEAASEAGGEARPRRLTIRRERTSDVGDTRPVASAAAVALTPAPALPTPVAAEGPPERLRREPRERPPPVGPAPDLSQLPPWPPQFLGRLRRLEEVAPGEIEKQEEAVLQNVQGLALTCLGSAPCLATRAAAAAAGAAGEDRALGSLALARGKDIFIFDVGDDTQRQVGQAYHVKPSKIFRIFLTSLAPEAVLGLPGLMCTINASRERGNEFADIPVHVYGPPGTAAFLVAMMRVSQTYLEITVVVHEFAVGHVSAAELAPIVGGGGGGSGPIAVDKNRRISRLALPPDQLNPRGGVDASLLTFAPEQGRAQRRKGRNASGGVLSFDARAGYLPWPELQPGDPDRRELPDSLSLTWTLELDVSGRVVACLLPAAPGQPGAFGGGGDGQSYVLAYTVVEADRSGALVMERAAAAGLEGGPDFARLKQGETIANAWGQPIPPELIISPKRAGRRVVVTGSAADLTPLTAHAHTRGADILVPGAVWLQAEADAAAEHGGCTTAAVGAAAAALGVRYVVLSRFSGPSATAAAGAAAAAGATAEQGLQDEEEDELPMDAHTNRLVAEVEAAALAAAGGSATAGSSGNEAAASTGTSRRRSVRKTAAVAGAGAGGSGYAGPAVAAHRLRRVLVLRDLETTMMEKNEGPVEPQEE